MDRATRPIFGLNRTSTHSGDHCRMTKRIPAYDLHLRWAGPASRCQSASCEDSAEELHHDHLMNFALPALVRWAKRLKIGVPASQLWQANAASFMVASRFPPAHVCTKCNDGDGWAKTRNWCGVAGPVYPSSFSMTLPELARMRAAGPGKPRRALAHLIWDDARVDHVARRKLILWLARAIVLGQKHQELPDMPGDHDSLRQATSSK